MDTIRRKIQQILMLALRGYRYFISPCLGNHCRFYPSCSEYAQQAFQEYSLSKATWLTLCRLLRCQPFHRGGYDPLPSHTHKP
jgi:hypothetical protein